MIDYESMECTNPLHMFKFKLFIFQWQIANDLWTSASYDGSYARSYFLYFGRITSKDGFCAYSIIIWKLSINFGIAKKIK